ncbi:MAG: hypothetical protein QOK43_1893 [Acidimicrobiaceae bacterium]|nr:hypothetical protein [Acidimicrobiaceae bacterium]
MSLALPTRRGRERTGTRRRTSVIAVAIVAMAMVAAFLTGAVRTDFAGAATSPSFKNYAPTSGLGADAAEPSIGLNPKTGVAMMQAGYETLRVDFTKSPVAWRDVGSAITSSASLDPILFTDQRTGRTFVSQLAGDCSLMAYSDNDGASWTENPFGCGAGAGVDHQTVGGGRFASGLLGPSSSYPDTVYYCAQAVATAQCSLSTTGGLTFGPAVPIYSAAQCGGLHGHIKASPLDGTVYVPNADCGGKQAVIASSDNGNTWTIRKVPGTTTQDESDPSVGVGSDGTVYMGMQNGDGHPLVSVSRTKGATWTAPVDVGKSFNIQNTQFPAVVAGDGDRAAFAFLGTSSAGNDQAATFPGVWHLYVATTYDRGATWTTVDATPTDPVQRGCIWLGGGSNTCRNLLDFMDVTTDAHGHILVGYADGCTATCPSGGKNTYSDLATIARQEGGTGLLAAYDGITP